MKSMTIRSVPPELAEALRRECRERSQSLNRTVLELLEQSLGVGSQGARSNGLRELGGGWSQQDLEDFEASVAVFEQVDDELWK